MESDSAEETARFGARLGARAAPGWFIALYGELGAGKTQLVRGIARGLGVPTGVRSPTFTVCHLHEGGRLPLFHVDAYRLEDAEELLLHGWDEQRSRGLVVVEWAERLGGLLPADRIEIRIEHRGSSRRLLACTVLGCATQWIPDGSLGAAPESVAPDCGTWWGGREGPLCRPERDDPRGDRGNRNAGGDENSKGLAP